MTTITGFIHNKDEISVRGRSGQKMKDKAIKTKKLTKTNNL